MSSSPLVWAACIFSLGICAADKIPATLLQIYLFCFFLLPACIYLRKKSISYDLILSCLIFFLAAALLKNSQVLSGNHISRIVAYHDQAGYTLKGYIENQPVQRHDRTMFLFRVEEALRNNLRYTCSGVITVYLSGKAEFAYGEALLLKGKLYPAKSWGRNKSSRGISAGRSAGGMIMAVIPGRVFRLGANKGFLLKRIAFYLKGKMEQIIYSRLSETSGGILEAMVLGEKGRVDKGIYNGMLRTGTVHILVVSGFNVGIVGFLAILLFKIIRLNRKIRNCLTMAVLILYCLITGASTPVVRATVMAAFMLNAYFLKREAEIYNSCALAALVILTGVPNQLFDIGFQLSFLSVISLIWLYPKLKTVFPVSRIKQGFLRMCFEISLASLSAWLATAGAVFHYFGIFSPVTVLANLLIVPLAALITLSGFCLIGIAGIFPQAAPLFAAPVELFIALLLVLNRLLLQLPGAYFLRK